MHGSFGYGPAAVAVAGAGIGGLTFAAALRAAGGRCTVFEQTRRLAAVGAGVQLGPNAVRPLHRLGLGPALRERAVRIEAMEVRGWRGELIARTPLGAECERRYGAPYYAVHRADLHAALLAAAGPEQVRLDHRLRTVTERPDGVRLDFADRPGHDADVLIGADGIHSVVRAAVHPDVPVFCGLGVFRGLVPTALLPRAAREPVVRLWLGPGGHVVCYPVSAGEQVSFAATTRVGGATTESWTADGDPAELRAAFAGWPAPLTEVLAAAGPVRRWALHDREPTRSWSTGRLTVLGDAAHPMLPFLAQGANQAVEDGVELAAGLARVRAADVPAALARYAARRGPRAELVQRGSRGNAALLHLPDGEPQQQRDQAMRAVQDLPNRDWLYAYSPLDTPVGAA